jgi:hypothetical protein
MAWTTNSMPSSAVTTPISRGPGAVAADEHGEVVECEHSDRVVVGVEDVIVCDPVLAGARHDDGIHDVNLP